jgi:phage terminase large subunit-like protein
MGDDLAFKQRKLELLEEEAKLKRCLPHLYGWKNYPWMRDFLECTNRTMFLTAANQIGKSSVQIRKVIDWATNKDIWPVLWRTEPRVFWYLYPARDVATAEFDTKWVPDFMPRGEMIDHPIYGWRAIRNSKKEIIAVVFNTGVTLYFKTYSQDASNLQTASVHYIATDEELPENLWDELNFRRNATDGYFSMVFTATLAQETWRRTMEPKPGETPLFPDAWKKQASLYECQKYEDGTFSHWSNEKIARTVQMCKSEAEVLKRVYGRFVADSGRKYGMFERGANVCAPFRIPSDWLHFVGVDLGAGGKENHPSAITFIAVKPDFSGGVVYKHWRGDSEVTSQTDVANKYVEMAYGITVTGAYYDYHARDFKTVTDRMGMNFERAEKSHEIGEQVINTLFKNKMLSIFDIPECEPIINELLSLLRGVDKRVAKDDSVDSMRYGVTKISWDWSKMGLDLTMYKKEFVPNSPQQQADFDRQGDAKRMLAPTKNAMEQDIEDQLSMWGELYDY